MEEPFKFKPGDLIRRKPEYQNDIYWEHTKIGNRTLKVVNILPDLGEVEINVANPRTNGNYKPDADKMIKVSSHNGKLFDGRKI